WRTALGIVRQGAPAPACAGWPGAPGAALAAAPARGHGGTGRSPGAVGPDARLAQPAVPQRYTGCPPGLGRAGPGRQAVRAVWAIVGWPVAAGGYCPRALPAAAGIADRRAGVGHGPGAGRPQPGLAQPPCPG